jgi:hypothetical protein
MSLSSNRVFCIITDCHSPYGDSVDGFLEGIHNSQRVLQEVQTMSLLQSSIGGETIKKKFRSYLKQRKAAKLFTPAAKLALGTVGASLETLDECFPSFSQQQPREHLHQETAIFFAVGREPPDDGDAEETLIVSERDGAFDESRMSTDGKKVYPPLLPLKTLPNMVLAHSSIHLGIQGENGCWAGDDEAGWTALWSAYWSVSEGRSDLAVLCGAESLISLGLARDRLRLNKNSPPSEASVGLIFASDSWLKKFAPSVSESSHFEVEEAFLQDLEYLFYDGKTHQKYHHSDNKVKSIEEITDLMGDCGAVNPLLFLLQYIH